MPSRTTNISRIFAESEKLDLEQRQAFESFILGWISGLVTPEQAEEAILEGYDYLLRTNRRKVSNGRM